MARLTANELFGGVISVLIVCFLKFSHQAPYPTTGYSSVDDVRDLKLVMVLYRHGDRAAIFTYPTDPYPSTIWPDGLSSLTKRGILQHFKLGRYLSKRYNTLLNPGTRTNQVFVTSSAVSRTLKSAQADDSGLFPPTQFQTWDDENGSPGLGELWQPIPVFSVPLEEDALFGQAVCPLYRQIRFMLPDDPNGYQQKYADLIKYVANHTNQVFDFPGTFYFLNDVLYSQSQNGFKLPDWVTPQVQADIEFMGNVAYHEAVGGNDPNDRTRPRLRGGNLLRVLMENLVSTVNGSINVTNPGVNMFVYSGHDENIAAILVALKQHDYKNNEGILSGLPNYASSLMFELFNNNTVRILYRNNKPEGPENDPVILTHPECTTLCPVDKLVQLAKPYFMTQQEYFDGCKLPTA